ncbi:roadblock/LC7 domain-containing protein [Roseateles sp. MS654]|uniref:roadblock/LC7 domain-containing protein n=1 Tax=Roseateles sp. MS654 TaxID=3412685 RepID=UPI003C2E95CF
MSLPEVLSAARASQARSVLRALRGDHAAIEACALMTSDGRVAASVLGPDIDPDRFGAMCAALLALAGRAAREAQRGQLQQLILEGEAGPVLLTRTGEHGVLAVAASPDCPLGRLLLGARTAAQALAGVMDGPR